MKSLISILITSSLFLSPEIGSGQTDEGKYEKTWESLASHETPKWFEDAVLGIYFHWGVYSVPAFGCWGGRNMYQPVGGTSEAWGHIEDKYENTYDYVTKVYGKPGLEFGYKDFIPMFKAEKWNPQDWADLFKESGADFAGPVAIHHDGFAMWDSDVHEYNAGDMGPKRDITGEILKAIEDNGLKTFASFHYYTNWIYFNPGRTLSPFKTDVNDPKYTGLYGSIKDINNSWDSGPMTEEFQQQWHDLVVEVIDNYHPDQLWFEIGFSDPGNVGEDYILSALSHYFNDAEALNKEVVVTRKDDDLPLSVSVLDIEAGDLDEAQEVVWQTDISLGMNHSWAYSPDAVSRPANMVIDEIIDRKSRNGVTLLSLAPMANGMLPPSQISALKEIGKWMSVNKEALHGSSPAPFSEGGTDQWKSGTMRFTQKGNFLYAIELGNEVMEMEDADKYKKSKKPKAPIKIPGVQAVKGSSVYMLGSDQNLSWEQKGENLIIKELPNPLPSEHAWAFKIQISENQVN